MRKETELKADAARMLKDIEDYVLGSSEQPGPEPDEDLEVRVAELEAAVADLDRRVTALERRPQTDAAVSAQKKPVKKKR